MTTEVCKKEHTSTQQTTKKTRETLSPIIWSQITHSDDYCHHRDYNIIVTVVL